MDVAENSFDELPLERLEAELTGLAGHLAAGECRFLLLLAAYDRRDGWREWRCRSCAHWLSWRCGIDLRTAQEKLQVAHALELFPIVRAAFAAGRISYSKARALTRIAGPDTEAELVEMALRATAAHMESIARGYARVERSAERTDPANVDEVTDPAHRRRVDVRDHDDPALTTLVASLTHEEMDLVNRALDAAGEGRSRADAVVLMAESYLATGPSDPRTTGGAAVAPETARRLCCDASFVWLLLGGQGEPVNISSRHAMPRAIRRLVRVRDGGRCRFPGCAEPSRCAGSIIAWSMKAVGHCASTRSPVSTSPPTQNGLPVRAAVPESEGDDERLRLTNAQHGNTIDDKTVIPTMGRRDPRPRMGGHVAVLRQPSRPTRRVRRAGSRGPRTEREMCQLIRPELTAPCAAPRRR
jgi:hypothetical protein